MTDIRGAILKAADHIERNPGEFAFRASRVPECGTPGCVVGWVAHFMGITKGEVCSRTEAMRPFVTEERGDWLDFFETAKARGFDGSAIVGASDPVVAVAYMRHVAATHHASDTESQTCDAPRLVNVPKFDFEALAQRLSREPQAITHVPA